MWGWGKGNVATGGGSGNGDADLWLELVAKFSVLASILVVIYFFVATTYRIARLPNGIWPYFYVHRRQELHQTPTPLPFTFQLVDSSTKNLNTFDFRLISAEHNKPEEIRCLWGVDAEYLCGLVGSPSWESDDTSSERLDKVLIVDRINLTRTIAPEMTVTITTPEGMEWSRLNGQYKYPLALFFSLKQDQDLSPTSIVGLCVVLHVKCDLIPRPTAILAQYIKLASGLTHKLQPLFVVDGIEVEGQSEVQPSSVEADNSSQPFSTVLCSACQSYPVSRAIVPCGHVCLCAHCFGKVQSCPMCRGPIVYFFKTRNESYLHDHQD